MNKRRVVITGLGVVSSIGMGWQEFWENLLAGKSGISPVTAFDTSNHFTHNGGQIKNFDPEFLSQEHAKKYSRATRLAITAADFAVKDAGLSEKDISDSVTGVCIGITSGAIQCIEDINDKLIKNEEIGELLASHLPVNSTPAEVAKHFNFSGPNFVFSNACAAGNYAIGYGYDLICIGKASIVFAGGADPFSRISFTGFNQLSAVAPEKCQPFDKNRKGMMVAEGAGIVVLEDLESALKRKAEIYAEVSGYGLSCDAGHMTLPSVDGVAECMIKALNNTGVQKEKIDYISAHGTGTKANDRTECAAIKYVFGDSCNQIPVSSIKSMLGHAMGAASALEAVACAVAVSRDEIPPTINFETPDPECDIDCVPNVSRKHSISIALNNSYAFGGNNACLVLKKYINQEGD